VTIGLKPIPLPPPAPAFSKTGVIGSSPSNQLLEDAVRGYNGFGGPKLFGLVLHEFAPDAQFLLNVPDTDLPGLSTNSNVYRRVDVTERGSAGEPNYVSIVTNRSPTCN
jgi:hypothetical protein